MGKEMRLISHHPWIKLAAFAVLAGGTFLTHAPVHAQTPPPEAQAITPTTAEMPAYSANRGHWNFGAQLGYSMEYGLDWHEVSHLQMLIAQPQLGFIVRDFRTSLVRRFEIIDEGILGGVVHPTGAYLAGDALIFRVEGREHGRWVPFFDAGAGVQRTPLSKHVPEVNGFTQFTPQGGFGLQYFIQPQRALVFEWRTIHMSNADLVPPNMGFNSSMLTIGFRWLRRPR
jgi:lipid A 3-O-deacylase